MAYCRTKNNIFAQIYRRKKQLSFGEKAAMMGEAAAIAIKMSEVCTQLVDLQADKTDSAGDNLDEATESDDGIEILELGILNETLIIDTNVFMHFPNEVQHIFANSEYFSKVQFLLCYKDLNS